MSPVTISNPVKQLIRKATRHKTLRHWALKAYAVKHPPPYRRPSMEFDFGLWNGISSLHSWDGRQIGENNVGPYRYKENIETEHEICKFGGSRDHLAINVTALRHVMAVWGDALQLTTLLRKQYILHRHLRSERFNLVQGYLFSKLGAALPAYLTRRKEQPVRDGVLPPLETAFFMLGVGPFMVVDALMAKGDLTPLELQPMSAEQIYELADSSGALVSGAGKGCAGSPKLIREFLDVTMNGTFSKPLDAADVQRALASLGGWNRFYDYAHAASRLELLVKLNQTLCAHALLTLLASGNVTEAAEQSALQTALQTALHHRTHVRVAEHGDYHAIVVNIVKVLIALLEDHGERKTLEKLWAARLLEASAALATNARGGAAHRIRQANALIYPACRRDLAAVHETLGRPGWGRIAEVDLLRRTGGPGLTALLTQLEVPLARRPAATALP